MHLTCSCSQAICRAVFPIRSCLLIYRDRQIINPLYTLHYPFLNEENSKRTQWISNDDNQLDPLPELQMSSILEKTYVWLSTQFGQPKQKWGWTDALHISDKKCAYMVRLGFEVHWRQITSINAINFVGATIYYFHITYNTPPLPTHPRKSVTIDLIYDTRHLCRRDRIDGIVCPMRNHVTLFLSHQSDVCYGECESG